VKTDRGVEAHNTCFVGTPTLSVLLALSFTVVTVCAQEPIMNARQPVPSPDGSAIAFSYVGDLWRVSSDGGRAQCLTVHEAYDDVPRWSPDGTALAFSSDRMGNGDVYVMDAWGGVPRKLTCHDAWDRVQCWVPGGSSIFFTSARDTTESELYEISIDGGMPRRIIADDAYNASVSPDGCWIAFVRGHTPWWRKHYKGSASRDIWLRAYDGGPSYHIVSYAGDDDRPMWGSDGKTLFFMSERDDAVMNIWKLILDLPDDDGEPRVAGPASQVTFHDHDGVQAAGISDDGTLIVYEWDAGVWKLATSGGEPELVEIFAPTDIRWNEDLRLTLSSGVTKYALSPDESQLALVVRGEVFVCPFDDGDTGTAMRITETAARERELAWMPDGETLLFTSDRSGNYDIFAVRSTDEEEELLSKSLRRETVRLTDSPEDDERPMVSPDGRTIAYLHGDDYLWAMEPDGSDRRELLPDAEILHADWSPDSKWIALSRTTLAHREDIFVLPVGGGDVHNITEHPNDDFQPQWTDDGKRLCFASRTDNGQYTLKYIWLTRGDYWMTDEEREDAEAGDESDGDDEAGDEDDAVVVEIDFDGINERTVTIMNMRGGYDFYSATPDGHHFAFRSGTLGSDDLWIIDWEGNRLHQVSEGGAGPDEITWDSDGTTCYYISHGRLKSVSISSDDGSISGRGQVGFSVRTTVNIPDERHQMFNEAWRLLWNGFYDPEFHGVDWEAMRERYEPWAIAAYTEEEFRAVVREMIGELSASHLGIYKWGGGGIGTGRLGIRHIEDWDGPGVKVRDVIPDSPADRAGVEPGDCILSIDDRTIEPGDNWVRLLQDTAGTRIMIEVADNPEGRKARELKIRPVNGGTMQNLIYEEWVRENRRTVEENSGGRVGYLHIAGMGVGNLFEFEEDLFAQGSGKDALVIDIRGNGGGSVHDQILRFLDRRPYGYTTSRTRPPTRSPLELWGKPLVLVIDETCYSDAEIFPMGWKALGLGPVVGVPTFGAVIGTNDVRLIDGTMFRVPGSGWFDLDDRNLENWGIEPDIFVESPPEEASRGHDAQLEKAVEVVLEAIWGK
jgi:tricorn protease